MIIVTVRRGKSRYVSILTESLLIGPIAHAALDISHEERLDR